MLVSPRTCVGRMVQTLGESPKNVTLFPFLYSPYIHHQPYYFYESTECQTGISTLFMASPHQRLERQLRLLRPWRK